MLSRLPISASGEANDVLYKIDAVENCVCSFDKEFFELSYQDVAKHTQSDCNLSLILRYVTDGWPRNVNNIPEVIKTFYKPRNNLSVCHGCY